MDTFDGSKPNLVNSKTIKDIESTLDNIPNTDEGNRVINGLGSFYTNYIAPNMFPLIVIALLILYLTIKYILKKDREEREEEEEEKEIKLKQIKKKIFKIDPDEHITMPKSNKKVEKEVDISDMISDDYLLTNDNDTNDEKEMNQFDVNNLLQNRDSIYDMNKAAELVFGEDDAQN